MDYKNYLKHVDQVKRTGYRPSVIAALIFQGKVGMFRSNKYPGFEFVQGGIEGIETPLEAIKREVIEELGYWFYSKCNFPPQNLKFLFEEKMKTKIKGELVTQTGEKIKPVGKQYVVFGVILKEKGELPEINEEDSKWKGTTVKFHEHRWVGPNEARKLAATITNPIKKEIALRTIDCLVKDGLIK